MSMLKTRENPAVSSGRRSFLKMLGYSGAGAAIAIRSGPTAVARMLYGSESGVVISVGTQVAILPVVSSNGSLLAFAAGDVKRQDIYLGASSGQSGFARILDATSDEVSQIQALAISRDNSKIGFVRKVANLAAKTGEVRLEELDLKSGQRRIVRRIYDASTNSGLAEVTGLVYSGDDAWLFYPDPQHGLMAVESASGAVKVALADAGFATGLRAAGGGAVEFLLATKSKTAAVAYAIHNILDPLAGYGTGTVTSVAGGSGCNGESAVAVHGTSLAYSTDSPVTTLVDASTGASKHIDPDASTWMIPGAFLDANWIVVVQVAFSPTAFSGGISASNSTSYPVASRLVIMPT